MWMILSALLACTAELKTTGERGMVGQLIDARAQPVGGQVIESVEAKSLTDASGRFRVAYKKPGQYVHFRRGPVWYRRVYRAEDAGQSVRLKLPATRSSELRCPLQCDAKLVWDLGDGFTAQLTGKCGPSRALLLPNVPVGAPELRCRMSPADQRWAVDDRGVIIDAIGPKAKEKTL